MSTGSEPGRSGDTAGPERLLAPLMIGLLALGAVAAFAFTQRLKREPMLVDRVEARVFGGQTGPNRNVFSPNGDCRRDRIGISFRTTRSDRGRLEVVSRDGEVVKVLTTNRFFKRYREHRLVWDGSTDAGPIAESGRYRLRMTLHGQDRVLDLPGWIRLHNFPPRESACPGDRP